ncbi:MAG: hypothetical protein AAFX03_08590 [Pseudomonadota bacterium]
MTLTVLAPAGERPLPLAAAKAYLRIGHDGEDGLVSDLLDAAVARVELKAGLALVERTLRLALPDWPALFPERGLRLRPAPVSGLVEARVTDGQGGAEDVTARLRLVAGQLCPRQWAHLPPVPEDGALEVDFRTGFGAAEDVPEDLIFAVKLLLGAAYQSRDGRIGPLPEEAAAVLDGYREARL